jgi:hypothetical protein
LQKTGAAPANLRIKAMPATVETYTARAEKFTAEALEAFEAGFASKAAQKRALDSLNRAFDMLKEAHGMEYRAAAPLNEKIGALTAAEYAERTAYFESVELPFDLHQMREHHLDRLSAERAACARGLIDLRAGIKGAEIAHIEPANKPLKELKARVEKSVAALMDQRKAQFINAVELGEIFGNLPVSLNAHYVHGHKGAVFIRTFYYVNGKLTPLNLILAALEEIQRRKDAKPAK